MLPVTVGHKGELLAVSCPECHVIRLHNVVDGSLTVTAFNDNDDKAPARMCQGESDECGTQGNTLNSVDCDKRSQKPHQ